ncbi:glutamate racemase [Yinghuangia seranimata]|uniref:glutamate racemase n=1 Tax=Yinghuangia seranimata TaxID=408067 RepID=UPI00248BD94F|nr:aspartate/glutamate racemase family protein [Yinghuangia seranimata]MDI2127537.1 aspartate/glutamate racemase family protein [Yinghuangia seranimata]
MIIALVDSGLGMLPTAGWLRHLVPGSDLVLVMDPDGMPWGAKTGEFVTERLLAGGRLAAERGADAVVIPCNTATVTAVDELRAHLEPAIPVIGTVPAVKPAAAAGLPFAVWATERTTASDYQAGLIRRFADGVPAYRIACPGLAEAVDRGDTDAVDLAVADAAARTPADAAAVVLGCTHYPLVTDRIMSALPPGTVLHDSAEAVARQALRRLGLDAAAPAPDAPATPGSVSVVLSGRDGTMPAAALTHPLGQALADAAHVPATLLTRAVSQVPARV